MNDRCNQVCYARQHRVEFRGGDILFGANHADSNAGIGVFLGVLERGEQQVIHIDFSTIGFVCG